MRSSAEAFERLFRKAVPDPAKTLGALKDTTVAERGDAVGFVYAPFMPLGDAVGMRILGLNSNSDSYHFQRIDLKTIFGDQIK